MRWRRECHRVREQMEGWEHSPPEWAQAHLSTCPDCARSWQHELRYRRVLQITRHEPMPASQLRWEQVQAQLTARAIRQRTLRWRFALSGAFASVVALAVLGSLWLIYSGGSGSGPMQVERSPRQVAMGASPAEERSFAEPKPIVGGTPTLRMESKAPAEPKATTGMSSHPLEGKAPAEPSNRRRDADATIASASRGQLVGKEATRESEPNHIALKLNIHREQGEASMMGDPGSAVALLPLPNLRPETKGDADYLPIQYGGSEESHVYSF